jgi:hypothetical protein
MYPVKGDVNFRATILSGHFTMKSKNRRASRPDLQSQIRLYSNGTIFKVRRELLVQKVRLFRMTSSEGIVQDNEMKTRVPREMFHNFVKIIEGCPFVLIKDNVGLLSSLGKEFGFDEFLEACEPFQISNGHSSSFVRQLLSRLCLVEHQCSLLAREFTSETTTVRRLPDQMTKFDRDTCNEFSKLSRLCEAEHPAFRS